MFASLIKALLLPPAGLFILAAIGLLVLRWPRVGKALLAASLLLLIVSSLPACSGLLVASLETLPALEPSEFDGAVGAIVVLGGDAYAGAPEFGKDTVGRLTLERLRYAAWLHRATGGVPLLTTGGKIRPAKTALGQAMAATLRDEFQVPVNWVEAESANTYENARGSAEILRPEGVHRIYLVTSARHMRRAKASFEAVGFEVIPAPTGFKGGRAPSFGDFVPRAKAVKQTSDALYEWFGLVWYHIAYL